MKLIIDIPTVYLDKLAEKAKKKERSRKKYIEMLCIQDAKKG